jgi:hypothetical protein
VLITGENGTGKGVGRRALHAAPPRRAPPRDRERRRALGGGLRERAVRPREGGLHRREGRPRRALRAGGRRDALPRRDRQRPLPQQAKLLRVLETGESSGWARRGPGVDVRILSATNADPRRRRSPRAASARTSSSASTPSRSACRRCATAAEDIPLLAMHFLGRTRGATARSSPASTGPRSEALADPPLAGQRPRARPRRRAGVLMATGPIECERRPRPEPGPDGDRALSRR